jgi:2Fe-2S ferredoxin
VFVHDSWRPQVQAPMSDEVELLTELSHYKPNSRLSCQVEMTDKLSGLRVTIAPDE